MSRTLLLSGALIGVAALISAAWVGNGDLPTWGIAAGTDLDVSLVVICLSYLVPAGLTVIAAGASDERSAATVAAAGLAGIGLGVVVYVSIGFALQSGGLGLVSDLRGAATLVSEWSPLDIAWGPGWGIIGLDGFFLMGSPVSAGLLRVILFQAVLAATAVCIPMLALARRLSFLALLGLGLAFSVLIYPIYGNWVWGGGYLSRLGGTVGLGHGFVDYAGAGVVHALGAFFALAAIVAFGLKVERHGDVAEPPPVHFPLVAVLGAFLLLLGWFGLVLGDPVLSGNVSQEQILFNVLLAACGGVLVSSLYVWFVTGRPDLLMVVRGMVASLVAISASCPFVSGWGALIVGAVAGLVLPLSIYVFEAKLRLDDSASSLATHGISGLWGLIALGVLADGTSGAGWNGVGVSQYLGVEGQGVSGLLVSSGFQPDWPAQLYAQVVGVMALLVLGLGVPWLVLTTVNSFKRRMARAGSESEIAGEESPGETRVSGSEDS